MKKCLLILPFALSMATSGGSTQAAFVSGVITGVVTATSGTAPGIAVGSLVSGSYTYDNSTTVANYNGLVNPLTAFSLTIGANPKVLTLSDLKNNENLTSGREIKYSTSTTDSLFLAFNFQSLSNYAGFAVGSQGQSFIAPQYFDVNNSSIFPDNYFEFQFTATPSTSAVPEPSSLALCGVAMAVGTLVLRSRAGGLGH